MYTVRKSFILDTYPVMKYYSMFRENTSSTVMYRTSVYEGGGRLLSRECLYLSGLARLRLANLTHVHTFRRGDSACKLRQREKSYYYDAREAHYNRFGPHAWFDPSMRGRTSHHVISTIYTSRSLSVPQYRVRVLRHAASSSASHRP